MRAEAEHIPPGQRQELVEKAFATLQAEPTSWESHLQWHAAAGVLTILAPDQGAALHEGVRRAVDASLVAIERGDVREQDLLSQKLNLLSKRATKKDLADPLIQLDERLQKLYQLLSLQPGAEERQRCLDKLAEWERHLNERGAADIPRFLRAQIAIAKSKEKDWLRPLMREMLKRTIEGYQMQGTYPQARAALREVNGTYFFASTDAHGRSREWQVELYSDSAPLLYFRSTSASEPGLVFAMDMLDGLDRLEHDPAQIQRTANKAVRTYEREHGAEQQQALNTYDFPPNRAIAHVRLFPQTYDSIVAKGFHTAVLMSTTLQRRYPGRVRARPPLFSDEPVRALRVEIQSVLATSGGKPMHFCIDVFSHGAKDHFAFEKKLEARDLVQIAKDFPQCTFTYNTIACYGAGMMKGLLADDGFTRDRDMQRRLTVFTQSKGDVPNLPAYATSATMYYVHLMEALNAGKTYGEAARIADLEVKKYLPVDAEALVNGQKLVMDKAVQLDSGAAA